MVCGGLGRAVRGRNGPDDDWGRPAGERGALKKWFFGIDRKDLVFSMLGFYLLVSKYDRIDRDPLTFPGYRPMKKEDLIRGPLLLGAGGCGLSRNESKIAHTGFCLTLFRPVIFAA